MNVEIKMRNSYQEETLMKMLAWMEWCGNIGHATSFKAIFDGDGTAELHCSFEDNEKQNKYNAIRKEVADKYNNSHEEPHYFEFGV